MHGYLRKKGKYPGIYFWCINLFSNWVIYRYPFWFEFSRNFAVWEAKLVNIQVNTQRRRVLLEGFYVVPSTTARSGLVGHGSNGSGII